MTGPNRSRGRAARSNGQALLKYKKTLNDIQTYPTSVIIAIQTRLNKGFHDATKKKVPFTTESKLLIIDAIISDYNKNPEKYLVQPTSAPSSSIHDTLTYSTSEREVSSAPLSYSEVLDLFNQGPVEEPSRDTSRMRQLGPKRTRSANSTKNSTKSKSKSKRASV